MSKFSRETFAVVGAIVGANLLGIVNHSKPVQSLECFQQPLQAIADHLQPPSPAQGEAIGGYYDVRLKKDVPIYREGEAPPALEQAVSDAVVPDTVQPVAPPVAAAPLAAPRTEVSASVPPTDRSLTFTDKEIDVALQVEKAAAQGQTLEQYHQAMQQGAL